MTRRIVIMGVSGTGKSTVGHALATRLGCPFLDADAFHPPVNVAKMSRGEPLDDDDRWPWLDQLNRQLRQHTRCVLACSALKRAYRERLRQDVDSLRFVHLASDYNTIDRRLQGREGHYMPPSLLQSQFDTLEPPTQDEGVVEVDAALPVQAIVDQVAMGLD